MDTNSQNAFEQRAQKILKYLKSSIRYNEKFLPRPFFIELTGSPSAGKTTTITELDKFFRHQGFRIWRPQEGAEVIRHIERTTPLYNIRTGIYALTLLIDNSMGHFYDIVIFDRCIFDAYCWMEYWNKKRNLSWAEKKLMQFFFLFRLWRDKIDAAYFMVCNPEEAVKREQRIALSQKLGETTNPETIKKMVERYKSAYETLSPKYSQLHIIDTTNIDEHEMVEVVAAETLKIFEEKIKEREG